MPENEISERDEEDGGESTEVIILSGDPNIDNSFIIPDEDPPNDERYAKKIPKEESIVCSECGKLVRYKHYDKHIKSHRYKCTQCPETFGTERAYETHAEIHSNDSFTCLICNINFGSAVAFSIHNQKHSGFGVYKCPLCHFETTTKSSMKPHIKLMHTKDYKRVCEICGKGFLNNAAYTDHMTLHLGEKKHKCEYCDKKFVLKRYLGIHKKLNHKDIIDGVEELYACQVCSRTFKFEKSLVRHLSCIHDIGTSKRVPCPVCHKIIANNYGLKIHMRTHSGEKPYNCELCDAKFARTKYLQRHMAKHMLDK